MLDTSGQRLVGIFVLIGCLGGLLMWFGALGPNPAVGAYPTEDEVAANYDTYLSHEVSVGGDVVDTDPLTIAVDADTGEIIHVQVTDTTLEPTVGDHVSVFGVIQPDYVIRANTAYSVPASNYLYMYGVSFLAGVWVLTRIVRTWTLDTASWSLVPREKSPTGDNDA